MQNAVNVKSAAGCGSLLAKLPAMPLDLNFSFLRSVPGMIKIAHTVLGMICLSVIAHFCQSFHPFTGKSLGILCSNNDAFFLLVTYGCFTTSLIMLVTMLFSYFTSSFVPKTAFEFIYHLTSCVLYLTSSINLLVTLEINSESGSFKEPGYDAKIAAAELFRFLHIIYIYVLTSRFPLPVSRSQRALRRRVSICRNFFLENMWESNIKREFFCVISTTERSTRNFRNSIKI